MSINWKHTAWLLLLSVPLWATLDFFEAEWWVWYCVSFAFGGIFSIKFPILNETRSKT